MKTDQPASSALSRRALLASTAALALAPKPAAAAPNEGDVILFQGDSITDAGRDRERQGRPNDARAMGRGYPLLIGAELLRDYAKLNLRVYNRGISGNKVPDLDARWQDDCIALKPAVLSILIGVNDIWHKLNGRYDGSVKQYGEGFHALVRRTRDALPDTRIVICEPFVLRTGAVNDTWFPEFDDRRAQAREVAQEANADWVPFHSMFEKHVAVGTAPDWWAADGVHPSMAGHALMAKQWRETTGI